eukprot:Opistho-2@57926
MSLSALSVRLACRISGLAGPNRMRIASRLVCGPTNTTVVRHGSFSAWAAVKTIRTSSQSPRNWIYWTMGAGALCIPLGVALSEAAESDDPVTVEPSTKTKVPNEIDTVVGKQSIVGVGVRILPWIRVRPYVVALYVASAKNELAKLKVWKDKESEIESREFVNHLTSASAPKFALSIVSCRETGVAHLRDGFARALTNRANKLSTVDEQRAAVEDIDAFKKCFPKGNFSKGNVMNFVYAAPGVLKIFFQGEDMGTINSQFVCASLLEAYLDPQNPISPSARQSIVAGFKAICSNL